MVLLIDNYDSFAYNLMQAVGVFDQHVKVVRNDKITVQEAVEMNPSHLIISPGPGYPEKAGVSESLIRHFAGKIPILGVCLGHQAICEVYGAQIVHAKQLMHGKSSRMQIKKRTQLFYGLSDTFIGARYHSLVADPGTLGDALEVVAVDAINDEIMAVKHREYAIFGLQFHPESILTPEGNIMILSFLQLKEGA